jgi:hypothetical protein
MKRVVPPKNLYPRWPGPLLRPQRDVGEPHYMAAAKSSRMLRVGSNSLSPLPFLLELFAAAKVWLVGFHRAHLSLRDKEIKNRLCLIPSHQRRSV